MNSQTALAPRLITYLRRLLDGARRALRNPWILAAVFAAFVPLWWAERSERAVLSQELEESRRHAAAETRALETRAKAAVRRAEASHAEALAQVRARRAALEREAQSLRARLALLQLEHRARANTASALDSDELTRRIATRLGPGATRPPGAVGDRKPETRNSHDRAAPGGADRDLESSRPQFPISSFQFPLDEGALRQIEAAFTELEGCRERARLADQLLANCEERFSTERKAVEGLERASAEWREAARLKDELAARREAEEEAALRAARGSRWQRFRHAAQYVAVGILVGVVVR